MVQRALTVVTPATALALVAWWSGGYFPRTWGAILLAVAIGLAAVAILAGQVDLDRRAAAFVGALVALCAWELVTTAWAVAPDSPALEAQRTLLYAGTAALAFLAVPKTRAPELVAGVLAGAGAATIGGLVEHGLGAGTPDDRLGLPVGYPNASGILAATTLVLGLGLTATPSRLMRLLGGAVGPPAAVALALSLSRGSILAAAVGLLVLCVLVASLRELTTLGLVAAPAAVAVVLVALAGGLDDPGAGAGELLVLAGIAGLMLVAAWSAASRDPSDPATQPSPPRPRGLRRRRLLVAACAVCALAIVGAAVYEAGRSRSGPTTLDQPSRRLLSTSTSSREEYWDVAARMVEDHPLGGAGAGGFTRVWLRERPVLLFVRDAHNLYLETLAELGPLGLAVLLAALAIPLLGLRRVVGRAEGRAAVAAYSAVLAHAALDWDWDLPAVTLGTVLLGVALVQLGGRPSPRGITTTGRGALLAGAALLGVLAIVVHAGNGATADANDLLDRGDAVAARDAAERARRFRPWAAEPWELLGEADLAAGNAAQAREDLLHATREDPGSWSAWLSLALASTGRERMLALARARALNPLAPELQAVSDGALP